MLRVRDRIVTWERPLLMGVVNANPDSFSDPGTRSLGEIVLRAGALVAAGADALDVGAQSAITNRAPADPADEAGAVVPVVREVVARWPGVLVSVDTFKPAVAEAALAAGAHLVNDVSGLRDPELARLCADAGAGLVVMHTSAPPLVRRQDPGLYGDVAAEVAAFLAARVAAAVDAGVGIDSIVVDPGVDFAKTPGQSVALLRGLDAVVALGRPVLLALSRKDFVGALTRRPPADRGAGTLGAVAAVRHVPQQILRVHDVAATLDMLTVLDAVAGPDAPPADLVLPEELRHQSR
ncbi:MAG TPA: dihydropteroate synthase [Acidimicrobiales bacterium]|nr:dihydropteroate synthase [Acidimicrobiales bacterium]